MTKMGIDVNVNQINSGSTQKTKKKPLIKISPIRLVNELGV